MTLVKVNNPVTRTFDGLMNDIFNELPVTFAKTLRQDLLSFPPVNIIENASAYQLELAVPGVEKADLNIKVETNILTVSADKKLASRNENEKLIRNEFTTKAFKRSFTLDEKIDAGAIDAKYENGILKLTLPKKEITKVASKEITVQ